MVVVWDTARAADVSAHAAGPRTTPVLERLAERATVYTRAGSAAPWTLPSHASLFTGLLPSEHGANETHYRLEEGAETLAEIVARRGYETIAVCANDMVGPAAGLTRGFRRFLPLREVLPAVQEHPRVPAVLRKVLGRADHAYGRFLRHRYDHGAARTNRFVDRALARVPQDRPVLLFVNYLDAHLPYAPPEPFRSRFLPEGMDAAEAMAINQSPPAWFTREAAMTDRDFDGLRGLYRGEIGYLDARLGELIRILHRHGRWDRAAFALTSDHGENIGDHGLMDHQASVHETLLRVPLVLKDPGQRDGRRVDGVVQVHDLAPTLLARAGTAFAQPVHGRPLPVDGEPGRDVAVAEYLAFFPSMELVRKRFPGLDVTSVDRGFRSARGSDDLKLIVDTRGREELFDLRADPGETADLAADRPEDVARLRAQLPDWSNVETTVPEELEAEIETHLRALGYVE